MWCENLTLYDIDNKEPGNVCRSAYPFYTGIIEKTLDITSLLTQISPHVECTSLKSIADLVIKHMRQGMRTKVLLQSSLTSLM